MHTTMHASLFVLALVILVLTGFSMQQSTEPPPVDARYRDSSLTPDERAADLLSHMTLEEKIGQMALVEKNSIHNRGDVSAFGLGAILSGGGGKPSVNTKEGWLAMITDFQEESRRSRTGVPILYGLDANHGHGNVPGATIFPHAIGIGAIGDTALAEHVARATAEEVRATGADWVYSPSLDLPTDIRWGRVYEAFSDDAVRTGILGAAQVRGFQEGHILATPKHYIGAGSMRWDTSSNPKFRIDQGMTPADDAALRTAYLPPFKQAIDSGARSVMVGMNAWGDKKMAAHKYLITDVLKGELGFNGFVVSDWYGVYEIAPSKYDSAVAAINAGVDMIMLPYEYELFAHDVRQAVRGGAISEARIDDAVRRILRVKFELGLFDGRYPRPLTEIGSEAHRALAREAAARSVVILKNDAALPISNKVRKIRVAGSAADNIGMQAGAWTYEWQGVDGNWLPGATSILDGLRSLAGSTTVQYEKDGNFTEKDRADLGIAIVGEKPYAEGWGDNPEPRLSDEDLAAIERLDASVRKLVVILVSGRPLIITKEVPMWDALVAAWLPGSEGAGVADALFGRATTTGTLPIAWPRSVEQLPFSLEGFSSDGTPPLYPRGFGLRLN